MSGTWHRLHPLPCASLHSVQHCCFQLNVEVRGYLLEGLNCPPAVGQAKDYFRIESVARGPRAPNGLDTGARIDEDAIKVEKNRPALEGVDVSPPIAGKRERHLTPAHKLRSAEENLRINTTPCALCQLHALVRLRHEC